MQQFEYQKKHAPPRAENGPVKVQVACPCSFRPYPHILSRDSHDWERHARGDRR